MSAAFSSLIRRAALLAWLVAGSSHVLSDSATPSYPLVATSRDGTFLFKMVPEKGHYTNGAYVRDHEAFGTAYRVIAGGEFQELWRTKGWYSYELFLSRDGRFVVAIGPWPKDQKEHSDHAIAFYDRGRLLKQFLVRDLLPDGKVVENSVSHYEWRPAQQTMPTGFTHGEAQFHLVTIDHIAHEFEVSTGRRIETSLDEGAKGREEIFRAEQLREAEEGGSLYEKSRFKTAFSGQFDVSKISVVMGRIDGVQVHLAGPEWMADLTPKISLTQACLVEAVLPILDGEIRATLTPQATLNAFDRCLAHPFVAARFAEGADRLRLRMTGDRLHWNTAELRTLLHTLKHESGAEETFPNWAYFIIDRPDMEFTSFYLNTETNEVLHEDSSKWPYETVLLNSEGKEVARSGATNR